ncbi:twitchin-like isoform X2 [Contarinia nasturtii]|uniref:twitchin-like isoform X2 n=1 Tax=Contarinia nasturtii TaxID=265458 RepID=UPI0012D38C51|nr:twitchin-like isoform X2 [Contarinia nasturtii]
MASPAGKVPAAPKTESVVKKSPFGATLVPGGSVNRRGSLLPPEEPARRPSLLISDKKPRPGEVLEDKKGRKASISVKDLDINQKSTPLRDLGDVGPPQIVDMYESYSAVEDETGYISVQVKGTPAPTFKFYKGVAELLEGVRYKFVTDGETNTITLCMRKVKPHDEGKYKIVISNSHGKISDETQMYVSKAGCVDFRALLRKSKYAKWGRDKGDPNWGDLKGVEKQQDQFLSPLQDKKAKEGKDKKVEFEAKFSKQNARPKWFCRKNELFMGVKYKFRNDGDTYQLAILNPKLEDSAKYTIDIGGVTSSATLTVEPPDPSYKFIKPLNKKYDGFTKHELILECTVSDPIAIVSWYKGDKKLSSDDKYFIDKDLAGVCTLKIKSCDLNDTGDFRCQLERQPDKTDTKVKVVEYPYKFVKLLRSQQNVEKDTVTLACELDDPLGEVKWLKDGKEIKPDTKGVQIVKDGRKRKLIIKDAKVADAGQYSCVSNADKTEAELVVNKQNKFNKPLKDTVAVEREKCVLEVDLEDPTAPVEWKLNGKPIKPSDRVEIKNLGGGKHQLVFNNLKMADAGEISAVSGKLSSSCKLTVEKGESKPKINAPNEFEGPINAPIVLEVPFKIDGKKQTPIEGVLLKDGKPLPSKDVEVQVKDDKVIFKIKKPTRDQSGAYQIKLSNGQGEDVKDVKITMQDVPNAPQDVNVRDVFEKSCIIDWKPPKDNGGTPLQKYIIERQDISKKGWESVGEVPSDKPTTFKVDDLTPKKTYKFRIRAVNKVGPSEPAEFKNSVLAKNPWDEPGKPKSVEVTDWDKDHADLKWAKPDNDGGAEISEYEIEVKDKLSKDWVKKKRVPASKTSTTVDDLKEGQQYEFRVRAVNKAGPGEPSDATKPIVAKCRFVKPFITGDQLKTIIIKKGQQFKYDIRYGGEPEPEVKWEKDGKVLASDGDRFKIEKPGQKTILTVNKCVRSDSGKYKLILTNSSGTIDSVGEVVVLDKPSPPKGPLVPEEIRAKHIKVKWQKPEDNGGTELTGYVLEKMDMDNGKWVPAGECGPNDETFTFKDLTPKKKYKLRVRAKNKEGLSDPLETTEAILAKNPYDEPGKPKNVEVTDWDKDHADLKWTKPENDGGAEITEYEIEIKDKLSKDWVKKKRVPASEASTTVDGLKEGQQYEFRVRAINKAGPGEPSDATKPIVAKCRFVKPFITGDQLKTIIIKKGQQFKYDIRYGGEPEPEVKWEKDGKVLASDNDRIKIEKPGQKTILTVSKCVRSDSGKYKLVLTNSSGTVESVGEVIVLDKPSPPKGPLVPEEVRAKHIKVKWQKPEDDGGCELTGYVLEKMDMDNGKWVPAGECGPNDETFTFKGLTPKKKYKLRVRAKNKEGLSDPLETTDAILAKNPFDEPSKPGKPEVVDYDNLSATLKWTKPEKDGGRPITHYTIEMKSKTGDWVEVLKTVDDKCTAVVDGLKEGMKYQFRVKAHNEGGPSEASEACREHTCKYKDYTEAILEYHFHTYFDVNDPAQVAHAIELRNEIIANCVAKKIIAIPLHYHYDPDNPVLEHNNDTTGLNMQPIGPHPIGSFETWVPVEYFAKLYGWFLLKRSRLTIFIHPLTKQELVDHTDRKVFMGKTYTLKTNTLREIVPSFKSQYEYLKLGYAKPKKIKGKNLGVGS